MPRDTVILECTEARKEGKRPSRYMTSRNPRKQVEKIEKLKYNPSLKRRTLHKEIKK
ncbi:MAG: 50S ribosomal protein L33 [Opitutales bacterium]